MRADGELVYFGRNNIGQFDVRADLGPVVAIAAGALYTCAVRGNDLWQCDVPANLGPVVAIAACGHTCAVRGDGELVCFGRNYCEQRYMPAIWDLLWQLPQAVCIPVWFGAMVSSSALDETSSGSAMCQQIRDLLWQLPQAVCIPVPRAG